MPIRRPSPSFEHRPRSASGRCGWHSVGQRGNPCPGWTGEQKAIGDNALHVAKATPKSCSPPAAKPTPRSLRRSHSQSKPRKLVVTVTWTGDADIDFSVAEPSGTSVSQREPRSTSGGVPFGRRLGDRWQEFWQRIRGILRLPGRICRRISRPDQKRFGAGPPMARSRSTFTNYGSEQQKLLHEQIPVGEKSALVVLELKEGRGRAGLPEAQVANVATIRMPPTGPLRGRLPPPRTRPPPRALNAHGQRAGTGLLSAASQLLRPVITQFQDGPTSSTNAVISADRRYVRVSPSPTFSQVAGREYLQLRLRHGRRSRSGRWWPGGGVGHGGTF